ncbi:hypothetical protein PENTCL1PPCAC_18746 [Pristionchus entomophagus]|uniref:Sphingomyelin phosphodiesterase n=1 Tax=Pristionchus entomophagus TaxID=358040 RepID=A0AAV5TQC7_9BILA|nr:hypothetical protein PENTCL1PPCAC_18746 [Pristionchus entomophagus]
MRGLLILVLLCLIPTSLSHAIPKRDANSMTSNQALNALKKTVRSDKLNCVVCSTIVQGISQLIAEDEEEEKINEFLVKSCETLDLWKPSICQGMIDVFASELYFVIERVVFTPEELCGIFVDDCGTPVHPLKVMWNLTIPGGKPAVKPWPVVNAPKKTQRVLHLADIHVDRDYAEGSEADCYDNDPVIGLCCRNDPDDDTKSAIKSPAGKWGSVHICDIPYRTFDAAMRHISETHKDIDYIILTGDLLSHDEWNYSEELTKNNLLNITQVLINYFPKTPIYEAVGNHEGVPCDSMAAHGMDEYDTRGPSWLYNTLADTWGRWISPESVEGVKYRASYVEYPSPGLKLISVNSVYCSGINFYMFINQTDPDGTLTWLISELLDSEAKGEKVHIISHIPAGLDYCLKGWAHNFYEIVNRFENTIAAQFYGHTHYDHFQVYYEDSNPAGRATHFNFIAPSITTKDYANPSYRIYTIDGGYEGASYTVLDSETYATDLDEANAKDEEPKWYLEYSAKESYGLADLSPASWADLINRMAVDDELFNKFHRFYFRSAHEENCVNDPACRQKYICAMRAAKSYEEDIFCAGSSTV